MATRRISMDTTRQIHRTRWTKWHPNACFTNLVLTGARIILQPVFAEDVPIIVCIDWIPMALLVVAPNLGNTSANQVRKLKFVPFNKWSFAFGNQKAVHILT